MARRLLKLVAAILLAANVLMAALSLEAASHHECPGDDCPVCALIATIAHAAATQVADIPPLPPGMASMWPTIMGALLLFSVMTLAITPVSLKVRLDL
ncbi:hypothetical protein [Cryptobacterium curtum]|uniref:hypothetical protein n=1 Tax=Cryptobacterium curtum TaxID=84163 RepID=UPI0028CFF365|nr:hypothetical protein [Cryptobacterium curtum]